MTNIATNAYQVNDPLLAGRELVKMNAFMNTVTSSYGIHSPDGALSANSLKKFQTPNSVLAQNLLNIQPVNMKAAQSVIRTNLSSKGIVLENKSGELLSVTLSYSQKKKDSVQAVLIQLYPLEQVTRPPNNIGLPLRLPDDIGLVQYSLSSIGGWDLNHINNIYSVQRHNLVNDVHSVDCLDLRCLRLISPFTAVTINCALLSPSSRFFSKSATTSCGKRAFSCCDLLLVELVAITKSPYGWCDSVYAKINVIKGLKCDSLKGKFKSNGAIHQIATPRSATNTIEASDHNVIRGNTMAMYKSTQTHPKFLWRFFSCQQSKYFSVEATSEQEARSMLPDSPCLFSARIRQEVDHA